MRLLLTNSAGLAAASLIGQCFAVVALVIAARAMDPADFGPLVAVVGVVGLIATVADFGLNAVAIRRLAADDTRSGSFAATLAAKVVIGVLLSTAWLLLSGLLIRIGVFTSDLGLAAFLLGGYLAITVISTTLAVPLRSAERLLLVAAGSTIERGVFLAVTAWLTLGSIAPAPIGVALGYIAGSSASMVFYYALLDGSLRTPARLSLPGLVSLWRESFMFGVSSLAVQVQRADVAVVAVAGGGAASGLYAAPARLIAPLTIIPSAFSAALYPRVAGRGHTDEGQREALVAGTLMLLITGIGLATIFVVAEPIVWVVLGEAYMGAVPVLRVFLVGILISSANQPMAVYLQAIHRERFVATAVLLAAAIGMAGVAVGASGWGAIGASMGFVLQQLFILAVLAGRFLLRTGLASGQVDEGPTGVRPADPSAR